MFIRLLISFLIGFLTGGLIEIYKAYKLEKKYKKIITKSEYFAHVTNEIKLVNRDPGENDLEPRGTIWVKPNMKTTFIKTENGWIKI